MTESNEAQDTAGDVIEDGLPGVVDGERDDVAHVDEDEAGERESNGAQSARSDAGSRPLIRKEYYSISEVADLVGLPAHVLRYWESQFSVLSPSKNRSGNRVYQRKEIKLILLVKQLLHVEKYTVEGAKQRIDQLRKGGALQRETAHALDEQMVSVLREELLGLRELLAAAD